MMQRACRHGASAFGEVRALLLSALACAAVPTIIVCVCEHQEGWFLWQCARCASFPMLHSGKLGAACLLPWYCCLNQRLCTITVRFGLYLVVCSVVCCVVCWKPLHVLA
jgi:hypothetical protein